MLQRPILATTYLDGHTANSVFGLLSSPCNIKTHFNQTHPEAPEKGKLLLQSSKQLLSFLIIKIQVSWNIESTGEDLEAFSPCRHQVPGSFQDCSRWVAPSLSAICTQPYRVGKARFSPSSSACPRLSGDITPVSSYTPIRVHASALQVPLPHHRPSPPKDP